MLFACFCLPIPFLRQQQWTVRSVKGLGGFGLRTADGRRRDAIPGVVCTHSGAPRMHTGVGGLQLPVMLMPLPPELPDRSLSYMTSLSE